MGESSSDDTGSVELLFRAGRELMAEKPVTAITASEIARRAGVAHGLLFHYFGTKQGFYHALFARFLEEVDAEFATSTYADPQSWLETEIRTLLDTVERHGVTMRAFQTMFAQSHNYPELENSRGRAPANRAIQILGLPDDPFVVDALVAGAEGAFNLAYSWAEHGWDRRWAETAISHLAVGALRGLAAARPDLGIDASVLTPIETGPQVN